MILGNDFKEQNYFFYLFVNIPNKGMVNEKNKRLRLESKDTLNYHNLMKSTYNMFDTFKTEICIMIKRLYSSFVIIFILETYLRDILNSSVDRNLKLLRLKSLNGKINQIILYITVYSIERKFNNHSFTSDCRVSTQCSVRFAFRY